MIGAEMKKKSGKTEKPFDGKAVAKKVIEWMIGHKSWETRGELPKYVQKWLPEDSRVTWYFPAGKPRPSVIIEIGLQVYCWGWERGCAPYYALRYEDNFERGL